MKILVISQYYYPDPFRLNEVVEGMVSFGHKVTVLTGSPNYITEKSYYTSKGVVEDGNKKEVEVIRVPTIRRRGGKKSLALSYISYVISASIRALFFSKRFDVIFVYQLSPILMIIPAWIARRIQKKRIALYCLDLWPESLITNGITHDSFIYKIMRKFSIVAYESVDFLGYSSKLFLKYFLEDLQLNQKRYEYIPQFAESIYTSIERKPHDGINYLFAGNIGESQSVETIVRAAALVKNTNIKWLIVGDGHSYQKCKDLSRELNVTDRVFFFGRKPVVDMPKYYSIADALVVTLSNNTIISYTLPGKVQSYMASGIPILVAASGETPEIIKDSGCGLCCKSEDAKGLAIIAEKMALSDRTEMGLKAKEYFKKHFTKERFDNSLEDMLKKTIES